MAALMNAQRTHINVTSYSYVVWSCVHLHMRMQYCTCTRQQAVFVCVLGGE